MSSSHSHSSKSLTYNNINPRIKAAKYAVRGELATRSEEYRNKLAQGKSKLPFDQVISANIGNPQQLEQKPLTFFRQVLSLVEYPDLLNQDQVSLCGVGFKTDAIERARWLLNAIGSVGAYSPSAGVPAIRARVSQFIFNRDAFPAEPNDIFLCAGASSGVNTLLNIICAKPTTGVLVPIPQYPLYTATLAVLGAQCVPYYLDESKGWGTDIDAIRGALAGAMSEGIDTRAIVIINPGNPTGASLSVQDMQSIIAFAASEKLVIIADEVYQTNVFIGEFHSFKRVLRCMQRSDPGRYDNVELASLHSTSKGMVGECGHRGGYFELVGFDRAVKEEINKFVSISLCAPVIGQCLVELMVNPPNEGAPSYETYRIEYTSIFLNLKTKAYALFDAFRQMSGIVCDPPQGSMYLYPSIYLPAKAVEAARKEGRSPDEFYCSRLLDATGICVVPGSGFGQKNGTFHFRTTFLAPGTKWISNIIRFHHNFMLEFS